jgi:hypothetical protein
VVETDPVTWLLVATERVTWANALSDGRLRASGIRTDLTEFLPLDRDQGESGEGEALSEH